MAIEIIFADHIGRADADLSRGQHSVPDQANNSHPADAEAARGFVQDQRSCARADDGTHARNTLSADNTDVQVFYPFHPLHGAILQILRRPERGDGAVCVSAGATAARHCG